MWARLERSDPDLHKIKPGSWRQCYAGGVTFDGIDARYMVTARPGTFVAGEMLDWEAPTGGYLLQACFATGAAAGRGLLEWLADRTTRASVI